jgi:hypothetical protein
VYTNTIPGPKTFLEKKKKACSKHFTRHCRISKYYLHNTKKILACDGTLFYLIWGWVREEAWPDTVY